MSGYIGLREDARVGARLAVRIARLFAPRWMPQAGAARLAVPAGSPLSRERERVTPFPSRTAGAGAQGELDGPRSLTAAAGSPAKTGAG